MTGSANAVILVVIIITNTKTSSRILHPVRSTSVTSTGSQASSTGIFTSITELISLNGIGTVRTINIAKSISFIIIIIWIFTESNINTEESRLIVLRMFRGDKSDISEREIKLVIVTNGKTTHPCNIVIIEE